MSATEKPGMHVVTGELHRVRRGRGKRFSSESPPEPSRRPASVAVMLAFAHTIQRAIDRGEIRDQADAARRLGVTRARMTQILDLTLLAPDLQEEILFSETTGAFDSLGGESLAGTTLRKAVRATSWLQQRQHLRQRSP